MLCIIKKDVADFGFKAKIFLNFFLRTLPIPFNCVQKLCTFLHTRFLFVQMAAEIAEEMR